MATLKDIAKLAGVSIATVSNYLNNTKPVSKEISQKIQNAVDELHYSINQNARNLKTKITTEIGVILPSLSDSYYVQLFQGIKSFFQKSSFSLNIDFSDNIPESELNIAQNFLKKQVCGLILVSCQPLNWKFYYDNFTSKNIPIVLIDRNIHSLDANFVSFNNRILIKNMVDSLLNYGFTDICLMSGPENYSCELECIRGFRDAFKKYNLLPPTNAFYKTDMSKEDAFRKTIRLLKSHLPQVIVTTSESLAAGIIEGITILGYTTNDIPVITLGEEHWNFHTQSFSSASTVRPAMKLGQLASKLLLEQLQSPLTKETEKIVLSGGKFYDFKNNLYHVDNNITIREKKFQKTIKVLMLDTSQVHSLLGLLKNFENKTGIRADVTILPHHRLYETIIEKYQCEDEVPYDVFMYDIPWLPSLASENILEDITKKFNLINPDIFLPNCLKYYSVFNGRYYGIPFMYAPQVLYYRKDLFDNTSLKNDYERENSISLRPPSTLKEFNTIAEFFTHKTSAIAYGTSIPTAYSECLTPEIYMRLRSYGGALFNQQGKVCLDSYHSLKAYINFVRSIKSSKPDYRTATDISVVEDFLNGETAMLLSYPSFLSDITDLRKSSIIGSIGYHLIPGCSPLLGGWSLGINSHSQNKEEAFEFLRWTCDEQIANYSSLLGGLSAINSTYTNDELSDLYPWLPLYYSIYKYTKPTIPPKLSNGKVIPQYEIDAIVCEWIYKLLDSKIDVQETITNTHLDLEKLRDKYLSS